MTIRYIGRPIETSSRLCQGEAGYVVHTRGGGLLSLEKGTNCGLTSQELSLSRAKMATKRGSVQL